MYSGTAVEYVRYALNSSKVSNTSMCTGPNKDELSMCLSNVGIMDGYFKDDDGPLSITEVTGLCSNALCDDLVFWCYTFHGKLRIGIVDSNYIPGGREAFIVFANKIFSFIEKN